MQRTFQRLLYVVREKISRQELRHQVCIQLFPLPAVSSHSVTIARKGYEVCEFMDEGDQECIRIQCSVHTDAVIFPVNGMTVIPKYGLSFAGDGKVDFVFLQIMCNSRISAGR